MSDQAASVAGMRDGDGDGAAQGTAHEATFVQRMRMLSDYPIGRALRFAVDLDLATILVDGPCTIEDLAVFTETDHGVLERNIRQLESAGVFRVHGSTVEVTELGASLARDGSGAAVLIESEAASSGAPADQGVRTEGSASKEESAPEQNCLVERDSFAEQYWPVERDGLAGYCPAQQDSALTGDVSVISSVLNDWTYDDFNRILGTLAAATPSGGRLALIELVLLPDGVVEQVGDTDPLMVAALGGRGHTVAEWTSVLAANGFRLERIRPGVPPFSFIEAVRQ